MQKKLLSCPLFFFLFCKFTSFTSVELRTVIKNKFNTRDTKKIAPFKVEIYIFILKGK